jgi:hypothetical protein
VTTYKKYLKSHIYMHSNGMTGPFFISDGGKKSIQLHIAILFLEDI